MIIILFYYNILFMGQCCAKEEDKIPQINIKDVCNDNECSCMSKCCISNRHKHRHTHKNTNQSDQIPSPPH
jgi:hypothetical protein